MTSLKKDIEELKRHINNSNDFTTIQNKISSQIDIYNMCNSMITHYKHSIMDIIEQYNNKDTNTKIVLEHIDEDNAYLLLKHNNIKYDSVNDTHIIDINGNIVSGNIGNIYSMNDPKANNILPCKMDGCKKRKCLKDTRVRNYYKSNWIYGNSNMNRQIGGKDTLESDLNRLTIEEKEKELSLRSSQLIHDILIFDKLVNNINDSKK